MPAPLEPLLLKEYLRVRVEARWSALRTRFSLGPTNDASVYARESEEVAYQAH